MSAKLVLITLLILVSAIVFVLFGYPLMEKGYIEQMQVEKTISLKPLGCFMPDDNESIQKLLKKLVVNKSWRVMANNNDTEFKQKGLLAYRLFNFDDQTVTKDGWTVIGNVPKNKFKLMSYRVLLVDIRQQKAPRQEFGCKFSRAS